MLEEHNISRLKVTSNLDVSVLGRERSFPVSASITGMVLSYSPFAGKAGRLSVYFYHLKYVHPSGRVRKAKETVLVSLTNLVNHRMLSGA